MSALPTSLIHLSWLIPLVLLIAYLRSPRFNGTMIEDRVKRVLSASLPRNQFTVVNGLTLPTGAGTRRIPHLVVSQFGLFVIETLYRPGRITGTRVQDPWTQRSWGRRRRFNNPMHQNDLNIQALEKSLNLPGMWFHSVVVLSSNSRFTDAAPDGVIRVEQLVSVVRNRRQKLMQPEACEQVLIALKDLQLNSSRWRLPDRWKLLAWVLGFVVITGGWFAFKEPLLNLYALIQQDRSNQASLEPLTPDQQETQKQDIWEASLVCAYSSDSGRCSCYEPSGELAKLDLDKCKDLAEKGSVLNR